MTTNRSILSHFASKVVGSVAGFAATFVIARVLGADVLGIYALVQSVIVWMVVPAWGISKATEKYVSEGENQGAYLSTSFLLSALSVAIVGGLLIAFSGYVSAYVGAEVTLLIVVLVATTVSFDTAGAVLKGEKQVSKYGWLTTTRTVLQAVFQILFVVLGFTITGLLVGHAAALVVVTLGALWLLRTRPTMPNIRDVRRVLNFARFSWMGGFKSKTFGWMDTLVLGFFATSSLIGVYEVAWTLSAFLVLASDSIRDVMFPQFSELSSKDANSRITSALETSVQYTGIIIIPGFFGALIIGPRLLKIYSPEFVVGSTVLAILILAQIFEVYGSQFVDVLNAVKRPDAAFRTNAVFTVTNLSLNVVLISQFGWTGAAVATLLSSVLTLLLGYYYLSEVLDTIRIPLDELGRQVVSALVMTGFVYLLETLVGPSHLETILIVFAGAVFYISILVIISAKVRQDVGQLLRNLPIPV